MARDYKIDYSVGTTLLIKKNSTGSDIGEGYTIEVYEGGVLTDTIKKNTKKQIFETIKEYKEISKIEAKLLGLPENSTSFVPFLEDLKKSPPNIVIGECVFKKGFKFIQNFASTQEIKYKQNFD